MKWVAALPCNRWQLCREIRSLGLLTLIFTAFFSYNSFKSSEESFSKLTEILGTTNSNLEKQLSIENEILSEQKLTNRRQSTVSNDGADNLSSK